MTYSTMEVAAKLGVNRGALRQWIKWGMVTPPKRQPARNGHRPRLSWTAADIEAARLARAAWPEHRGRRRKRVDRDRVAKRRADGASWYTIGREMNLSYRTLRKVGPPVESHGKPGRPRKSVDRAKAAVLRAAGLSWAAIGKQLSCCEEVARRCFV